MLVHPIAPVFDSNCRVLVLGSFPSAKSRETGFYYGHPRNRFWQVLSAVFGEPLPRSREEKRAMLLRSHVALWDVIHSCEIVGSSDSSIRNTCLNDLSGLLSSAPIEHIYLNGSAAAKYYSKSPLPDVPADTLPSTSPANARYTLEMLTDAWSVLSAVHQNGKKTVEKDAPLLYNYQTDI